VKAKTIIIMNIELTNQKDDTNNTETTRRQDVMKKEKEDTTLLTWKHEQSQKQRC
jgi:hypothetical protein